MTNQSNVVLQKPTGVSTKGTSQNTNTDTTAGDATTDELELLNSGSDSLQASISVELLNDDETQKSLPQVLPVWYTNLDQVSRSEVRHLCEEAGVPPFDQKVLSKLQNEFNVHLDDAVEVVKLFYEGKLQETRNRPRSILKSGNGPPPLRKQLSWSDENGGNLTQRHEMDSWHYMDSKRTPPTPCCSIL